MAGDVTLFHGKGVSVLPKSMATTAVELGGSAGEHVANKKSVPNKESSERGGMVGEVWSESKTKSPLANARGLLGNLKSLHSPQTAENWVKKVNKSEAVT